MTLAPPSVDWAHLVAAAVAERGSLAEVVRTLYDLHGPRLPQNAETVERGLRRLRRRGHAPADKYGRLMLRSFGIPRSVQRQARALGTYHSPLMDLPLAQRAALLRLWDRPPVLESAQAAWIHLGMASLAHHRGDLEQTRQRLQLAELGVPRAGPAAAVEWGLFAARLDADSGIPVQRALQALLDRSESVDDPHDRACYHARVLDQAAYDISRDRSPQGLARALELRQQIPRTGPPFVRFKRALGLAWTLHHLGQPGASDSALQALAIAGDAGLLRLRAGALGLIARIIPARAETARQRRDAILQRIG